MHFYAVDTNRILHGIIAHLLVLIHYNFDFQKLARPCRNVPSFFEYLLEILYFTVEKVSYDIIYYNVKIGFILL